MDQSPNLFPYYMRDNGIAPGECKETAKTLGLQWTSGGEIDAQVLENALKAHGPYWVAGMWTENFSHVVVVTGVNVASDEISYINPWKNYDLSESSGNMRWLNARGDIWRNCDGSLMYWL